AVRGSGRDRRVARVGERADAADARRARAAGGGSGRCGPWSHAHRCDLTCQRRAATMPTGMGRRVIVLHNTDYDEELTSASKVDVSEVKAAAMAVLAAAREAGLDAELWGVHGRDLEDLIGRLRRQPPDLVLNLCESLAGDARNEIVVPAVLDMLRVPYTGPGPLTIGLCLHKDRAKGVLAQHGVATPP